MNIMKSQLNEIGKGYDLGWGTNKAQIILLLVFVLCASIVSAQTDNSSQTSSSAQTGSSPQTENPPQTGSSPQADNGPQTPTSVSAYGQNNPGLAVSENPPISAIDTPGLEPHAAPESFLLLGAHVSESADSNLGNELGGSSVGSVTRGLGSLTLQRLWKRYDVALDYVGGVANYTYADIGLKQLQQLDVDNRINWKRGQLAIRDAFSYLPEGNFGGSSYGGIGGLQSGLVGAGAFGGQTTTFLNGNVVSLGITPRLTNAGLVDVVQYLSPKSVITAAGGYGLVHFLGNTLSEAGENISFLGSRQYVSQVAYVRILNAKNQAAISYGYEAFNFVDVNEQIHANVIQAMYGHRVSGRMDFLISAGPQFIHDSLVEELFGFLQVPLQANHIGLAGLLSFRYQFPKTSLRLTLRRFETSGSGVFAGAETSTAQFSATRPLSRVWDAFVDLGYVKNSRLEYATAAVNANSFSYGYGGIGVHRYFGRSLRAYASYQYNELGFDSTCPIPGTSGAACSHLSQRQVGTVGLDWTFRPIRLD
jgi:hypothetical protein